MNQYLVVCEKQVDFTSLDKEEAVKYVRERTWNDSEYCEWAVIHHVVHSYTVSYEKVETVEEVS